jgi:S-adenosyl methyltransferase
MVGTMIRNGPRHLHRRAAQAADATYAATCWTSVQGPATLVIYRRQWGERPSDGRPTLVSAAYAPLPPAPAGGRGEAGRRSACPCAPVAPAVQAFRVGIRLVSTPSAITRGHIVTEQPVSPAEVAKVTGRTDVDEKASPARVYDFFLGGTNNYAVDRVWAERAEARYKEAGQDIRHMYRANRGAVRRAVEHAIREHGIRQIIDIGSGLPTVGNVHEVADEVAPGECSVLYVDNETIAHAHSDILLGRTADRARHRAVFANLLEFDTLWDKIVAEQVIRADEPVLLMVMAVLHFIGDTGRAHAAMAYYRKRLPPGSLLAISHGTFEAATPEFHDFIKQYGQTTTNAFMRSREEIMKFFGDFELVTPLDYTSHWLNPDPPDIEPWRTHCVAGIGQKK